MGGARIVNNKFSMSGALAGVAFQLASGQNSSLVMVSGNSFEQLGGPSGSGSGIVFRRLGTTGVLTNVTIGNNEFEAFTSADAECVWIPTDANGSWVVNLNISNNMLTGAGGSYLVFADIDGVTPFSITGNIGNFSGGLGTSYMVVARGGADRGVIGPNVHTTGINASIVSSTNTTTISPT